jgi:hypothetical protein
MTFPTLPELDIAGAFHAGVLKTQEALTVLATSDDDNTLGLFAGFFIGLYLVYDGFDKWRTKRLMKDTPTEKVRSMAAGRTELEGVATNDGETVEAPFTDDECLHIDWEVEEWRKDPDDDHHEWRTIAQGQRSVKFSLDDGTGEVLVRADAGNPEYEISDANTQQYIVGTGNAPPPEVEEFIQRHDSQFDDTGFMEDPINALSDLLDSDEIGYSHRRRRYTQEILPDGSDVYVLGSALQRDVESPMEGQEDLLELTRDEGLDELLISDRSEQELESHYEKWGPLEIVGGLALSAVCLGLLLLKF